MISDGTEETRESGAANAVGGGWWMFTYNLVRYQGVWRSICCGGRSVDVPYIGWGSGKGHNEMLLIFCYFVYLVFFVFVLMSFGILHHLLLLSEAGQSLG